MMVTSEDRTNGDLPKAAIVNRDETNCNWRYVPYSEKSVRGVLC